MSYKIPRGLVYADKPTRKSFRDITGQQFGRLRVVSFIGYVLYKDRGRQRLRYGYCWECQCECGNRRIVFKCALTSGRSQSCGCWRDSIVTHHGQSRHPLFPIWQLMIRRTTNPQCTGYQNYGGRGIRVCQGWLSSFSDFLSDIGPKPGEDFSVDRRDNDGGYWCGHCAECKANGWPANCRWATRSEQGRNTRQNRIITYQGQNVTLTEAAQLSGIPFHVLRLRLIYGWQVKAALETPVRKRAPRETSKSGG